MHQFPAQLLEGLNESPSEKEGKCFTIATASVAVACLNESPSEKEGKLRAQHMAARRG